MVALDVGAVAQTDFHRHFRAAAGDGLGAHAMEAHAAAQLVFNIAFLFLLCQPKRLMINIR